MSDRDTIERAIRHIDSCLDVDPWARDIAIDAMMAQLSQEDTTKGTTSDCISRQAAIDEILEWKTRMTVQGLADRIAMLPSVQQEPHWIPCNERLPEYGRTVLWCNEHGSVFTSAITYMRNNTFTVGQHRGAIAWMPLPDSYRGGEKDE